MTAIVCLALSAAAVVVAVLAVTKSRYRRALRWAAFALVPTGLYLTGLITVFSRIGHAIGDWAADLVFDPRVWTGICMLVGAVALALLTGLGRRRSAKSVDRADGATAVPGPGRSAAVTAGSPAAQAPARPSAKAPVSARAPAKAQGKASGKKSKDGLDDFADIEEILKRRGL
jgi:hypothetical protein